MLWDDALMRVGQSAVPKFLALWGDALMGEDQFRGSVDPRLHSFLNEPSLFPHALSHHLAVLKFFLHRYFCLRVLCSFLKTLSFG